MEFSNNLLFKNQTFVKNEVKNTGTLMIKNCDNITAISLVFEGNNSKN